MFENEESSEALKAEEIEVLKAIFPQDIRIENDVLIITLQPYFDNEMVESHTQIDLHIIYSESYPHREPEIILKNSKGLSNQEISLLLLELQQEATKIKGKVMIYELVSCAKAYLTAHKHPPPRSFYEQMESRKKQQQQEKDRSEEDKMTKKIQDLQEEVSQKEKEALMLKENDSSDEGDDLKHVKFSLDEKIQRTSSGSNYNDNEAFCEHKCCKYIQFKNKILRGRCMDHDANSVLYWAVDSSTGDPLLVREWILKLRQKNKDALSTIRKQLDSVLQEMNYLKTLQNENILSYIDFKLLQDKDEWTVYLLQEYVSSTTISIFLSRYLHFNESVVRHFVTGILNALSYLHYHNVVHKNLKESYVYVNKLGAIKLASHSLVRRIDDIYQSCNFGIAPASKDKISPKSDIKQLGFMLLNMFGIASSPNESFTVPDSIQPELKDFIEKCLIEDEEKRWTAKKLMFHKFVKNTLSKGLKLRKNVADKKRSLEADSEDEPEDSADFLISQPIPKSLRSQSRIADEFKVLKDLGSGSFGKVLKAKNKLDGRIYAVKEILLNPRNKTLNKKMIREVKLLSKLNHENVVRYYNSWIETRDVDDSRLVTNVISTPLDTLMDLKSCKALEDDDQIAMQMKSGDGKSKPEEEEDDEFDDDEDDYDDDEDDDEESSDDTNSQQHMKLEQSSYITFEKEEPQEGESLNNASEHTGNSDTLENAKCSSQIRTMYIQMEFCEKSTLRTAIDDDLCKDESRIWRLFREITEGLTYIHEQGMIHRDLKPVNIFLDYGDHVKIGDFGLATTSAISKSTLAQGPLVTEVHLGGGDSEISCHTIYEDSHTGDVGTAYYVAPELKKTFGKTHYNKKVDIYSLGIIFFEMCHNPFVTGMERCKILTNLRLPEILIPIELERKMPQQMDLVKMLLNHDPMSRPSCEDILQGDYLPPPEVEDRELQELLRYTLSTPQSKAYKYLISSCFDQKTSLAEDLTYHYQEKAPSERLQCLHNSAKDRIERILKRHGAGYISTPLLLPKNEVYTNIEACVKMMTHSGSIVGLPFDLRVPFAKHVVRKDISRLRRYATDRVYREKRRHGFHPKELYECAFDIVTPTPGNLVADAEMLSIINEIVHHFPALSNRNCHIRLNHSLLLRAILSNFNAEDLYSDVYKILIDAKDDKSSRNKLETNLLSLQHLGDQIACTLATLLQKEDGLMKIKNELDNTIKKKESIALVKKAYEELNVVISNAQALGLNVHDIPVKISLGTVYYVEHGSGMMFDFVCEVKQKKKKEGSDILILASGCRYDGLLAKFRKVIEMTSQTPVSQSAVGMSIFLDQMVRFMKEDEQVSESVVVCSLGQSSAIKSKAELIKKLWAAGIQGFVLENVDSLEELQSFCQENQITHMMIVKEMEKDVRVRSWEKEKERHMEKKVNFSEVTEYVMKFSKMSGDPETSSVVFQRQDSKMSSSISSSNPTVNIHIVIEDKMSATARRRHEAQIRTKIYPSLDKYSSHYTVEIVAAFLEASILKNLALLDLEEDLKDYSKNFPSVIEKSSKKKYILKIWEKIHSLHTEKSNIVIILYSITEDKYKPIT